MAEERPLIGGCDFPVDPDIAAPSAPVFWRPVKGGIPFDTVTDED